MLGTLPSRGIDVFCCLRMILKLLLMLMLMLQKLLSNCAPSWGFLDADFDTDSDLFDIAYVSKYADSDKAVACVLLLMVLYVDTDAEVNNNTEAKTSTLDC